MTTFSGPVCHSRNSSNDISWPNPSESSSLQKLSNIDALSNPKINTKIIASKNMRAAKSNSKRWTLRLTDKETEAYKKYKAEKSIHCSPQTSRSTSSGKKTVPPTPEILPDESGNEIMPYLQLVPLHLNIPLLDTEKTFDENEIGVDGFTKSKDFSMENTFETESSDSEAFGLHENEIKNLPLHNLRSDKNQTLSLTEQYKINPQFRYRTAEKLAINLHHLYQNYRKKNLKVYLMARPLSKGTIWKKMRSSFTGGKPAHVALIASFGPGRSVTAILTGQENSLKKLAISNRGSDVAQRDSAFWTSAKYFTDQEIKTLRDNIGSELICPKTGSIIKRLSNALTADQLGLMYEEFKSVDSFRGKQNTRQNYANGFTETLKFMGPKGLLSGITIVQPFAHSITESQLIGFIFGVITSFVSVSSPKFGANFLIGLALFYREEPNFSLGYYLGYTLGLALALKAGLSAKGTNCQTLVSTALIDYQEIAKEQDLPLLIEKDFMRPKDVIDLGWKYPIPETANNNQPLS
ncbi:MAG: hypothetical protein V4629_13535 [Pseudomonadota bacterium]